MEDTERTTAKANGPATEPGPPEDVEVRRFGDLTLKIDRLLCVGFGDCIDEAPGVFHFDDEGIAAFNDETGEPDRELLLEACRSCPVDALVLLDESGNQLHP